MPRALSGTGGRRPAGVGGVSTGNSLQPSPLPTRERGPPGSCGEVRCGSRGTCLSDLLWRKDLPGPPPNQACTVNCHISRLRAGGLTLLVTLTPLVTQLVHLGKRLPAELSATPFPGSVASAPTGRRHGDGAALQESPESAWRWAGIQAAGRRPSLCRERSAGGLGNSRLDAEHDRRQTRGREGLHCPATRRWGAAAKHPEALSAVRAA